MNRLNTDRSLAPLVAQFVPLKVETAGEDWGRWARKYPHEGNSIPIIYVIRADGEKLYGRSGALNGDALRLFLAQQLLQAGRPFSDREIEAIEQSLAAARAAADAGDPGQAVRELGALRKIGELGNLKSYAQAAVQADQFVAQLTSDGRQACEKITEALGDEPDDPFATLFDYVEIKRDYAALPGMKVDLANLSRSVGKSSQYRDALRAAERLHGALSLAETERSRKRGIDALQRIVQREAGSPSAERAAVALRDLGVDPAEAAEVRQTTTKNEMAPLRTWTDTSGKYQIEARLVGVENDQVVLMREDGTTIRVSLDKLSDESRRWVK